MKIKTTSFIGLSLLAATVIATPECHAQKTVQGQRKYNIIVNQANDTLSFNRNLRAVRGNRSLLTDLIGGYASLGTSTLLSASQTLLGTGIALISEAARDKRPDWEKATLGECKFVKHLPSQTEILDFYGAPSNIGAMDPTNMLFNGFGCSQMITVIDEDGKPRDEEVFYLSCSLKDDQEGIARMLNHSKFEMVVDELRFNPYLCNLPNDSLSVDPSTRIGFDFDKRKDLEFQVVANLSSSWLNEAIQVQNDVPLGTFVIKAKIDPKFIGDDNTFVYRRGEDEDSGKVVTITGDSFLVPRSYVGFADIDSPVDTWGTGQYKVEMDISESCKINQDYYTEMADGKRKWNNEWKEEWKLMKKRPKRSPMQASLLDMIFPSFTGKQWITTIIEPAGTVLLKHEGQFVNAAATKFATKIGAGASAAGASPAAGMPSGMPSQGNGNGNKGNK